VLERERAIPAKHRLYAVEKGAGCTAAQVPVLPVEIVTLGSTENTIISQ
jgi:hypothetical protein